MKVNTNLYFLFIIIYIIATSALDNESEKIVQDALDRAAQGVLEIKLNKLNTDFIYSK
jgi:ABC-type transport system involved in Fe-S cluster assembly fused permease/ATPase subunit